MQFTRTWYQVHCTMHRTVSYRNRGQTMSTYNIEFPKWRDEVYRKHSYDPRGWYGAEVAEKMHQEAMRTYIGPAATAKDYLEVQHTQEEDKYFAFIIKRVREKNIDISKLSDSERWKLMDELVNEYFGNS